MSQKLRILLVRHGQSQSNKDWSVNKRVADHAIELTDEGKEQARQAGKFLADWIWTCLVHKDHLGFNHLQKIRLWNAPYARTRQTRDGILETCVVPEKCIVRNEDPELIDLIQNNYLKEGETFFESHREHLLLHEQQFGLFDGLSDNERRETFPEMQAYYEKCKQYEGKLWPIMPLGESRIQVCSRVHQTFGTFHRDHDKHGISTIVVVGHGTTNRAFVQMWLHREWEWMHNEPNPNNCSIRLIESGDDCGYIFNGFDSTKNL